ncbi:uncharacterized protein LOC116564692 isoform X1 [Sapajus apella]|uniref:Uncharacterized protein LOC116564692 isoform X1 n=1 Tax=Sapajus apella TaxID=9515 RepID=A0A6J3JH50_SAPAP|nr:uncharacterized protein LOC116564692 isoform X1 [Sapajus apella]
MGPGLRPAKARGLTRQTGSVARDRERLAGGGTSATGPGRGRAAVTGSCSLTAVGAPAARARCPEACFKICSSAVCVTGVFFVGSWTRNINHCPLALLVLRIPAFPPGQSVQPGLIQKRVIEVPEDRQLQNMIEVPEDRPLQNVIEVLEARWLQELDEVSGDRQLQEVDEVLADRQLQEVDAVPEDRQLKEVFEVLVDGQL